MTELTARRQEERVRRRAEILDAAADSAAEHGFDAITPVEEVLGTLDGLVRAGKIRYFGVSNYRAWRVAVICRLCDEAGIDRPIVSQPYYNAMNRMPEVEHLPACGYFGLGVVPLAVSTGAGSASRVTIGIVVIFGVAFSTLLSLLVVPAFYMLLAPFTRSPDAVAQELERLESLTPEADTRA